MFWTVLLVAIIVYLLMSSRKCEKREDYGGGYVLDNHQCNSAYPCPLGQKCALGHNGRGICLTSPEEQGLNICGPGSADSNGIPMECPPGQECVFYGTHYGCTP